MTKNKVHILILTPGFPKDENDFNCIPPLQEYLLKFKSSYPSAEVSVITFQYLYRNTQYLWNGINIYPMAGKNKVYMKPLVWLRAIKTAKNLLTTSMDYNPVNLFPLIETAERYARIYGLK